MKEIASMMTAPDPGAALGAKAVSTAGRMQHHITLLDYC